MINEMKYDKMFHIDVFFFQKCLFGQCPQSVSPYIFLGTMYGFPSSDFKFRGAWGEVGDFPKPELLLSLSHEKIVRRIKVFLTTLHSFVQSEFWEHILFSLYFHKIYLIQSILRMPLMWSVSGAQYKNISFFFI